MSRQSKTLVALGLFVALSGCDPRPRIERLEGQVTVSEEHTNWEPIDPSLPAVFDGSAGLEVREAVGIAVAFSAFYEDPNEQIETYMEGRWTAVSDDAEVAEVFSAPYNTLAIVARSPGNATLTLTLVGHPGSFEVPIVVVPAGEFEPGSTSNGGGGAGGEGVGGFGGEGGLGGEGLGGEGGGT